MHVTAGQPRCALTDLYPHRRRRHHRAGGRYPHGQDGHPAGRLRRRRGGNCAIGVAITIGQPAPDVAELLSRIQNELFDVGADLANPITDAPPPTRAADRRELRRRPGRGLRRFNEDCPRCAASCCRRDPGAALLHTARTVTRRAERSAWAAVSEHGDSVNPLAARYLNRLSDLLFILGRRVNGDRGDVLWKPGGER